MYAASEAVVKVDEDDVVFAAERRNFHPVSHLTATHLFTVATAGTVPNTATIILHIFQQVMVFSPLIFLREIPRRQPPFLFLQKRMRSSRVNYEPI